MAKLTATDFLTLAYEDIKDSHKCYITVPHLMGIQIIKVANLYWKSKIVTKVVFIDKRSCTLRLEQRRTEADNFKVG